MDLGGAPGMAAALIADGKVTYFSRGISDLTGQKFDQDSTCFTASIGKLFTTLALTDMVREGLLDLDGQAAKYVDARLPESGGKKVTLRNLATHTSGLPQNDQIWEASKKGWKEVFKVLGKSKLDTVPGQKFSYSGLGMSLLGHVEEVRAGKPYDQVVKERVLAPLGMDHTSTRAPVDGPALKRFNNLKPDLWTPAGGWLTTTADLARFAQAALGSASETLNAAFEMSFPVQFKDEAGSPMFLGWHAWDPGHPRRLYHTGTNHAYLGVDLDKKVAVVIVLADETVLINGFGDSVLVALGGGKPVWNMPHEAVKLPAQSLALLVGDYLFKDGGKVSVESDPSLGILLLNFAGKGEKWKMWPDKDGVFHCKEWHLDLKFPHSVGGQAQSLTLEMDNFTGEYKRVAGAR